MMAADDSASVLETKDNPKIPDKKTKFDVVIIGVGIIFYILHNRQKKNEV